MTIDLSKAEIEIIQEALEAWEKEPHTSMSFNAMIGAIMTPKDQRLDQLEAKDRHLADMRVAEVERRNRREKSILLLAKLYQAIRYAPDPNPPP